MRFLVPNGRGPNRQDAWPACHSWPCGCAGSARGRLRAFDWCVIHSWHSKLTRDSPRTTNHSRFPSPLHPIPGLGGGIRADAGRESCNIGRPSAISAAASFCYRGQIPRTLRQKSTAAKSQRIATALSPTLGRASDLLPCTNGGCSRRPHSVRFDPTHSVEAATTQGARFHRERSPKGFGGTQKSRCELCISLSLN